MKREVIGNTVILTPDEGKRILHKNTGRMYAIVKITLEKEYMFEEVEVNNL